MLKDRLKEIDIRITELSDYLQVSRPTMYKFIDYYDECNFESINKKVLKLFNYIMENELAGKKNVVNYILNNLVEVKELGDNDEQNVIKNIKKYLVSNPESKKSQFLELCVKTNEYDEFLYFLVDIYPLLKRKNLTDDELNKINQYKKIREIINNK